MGVFDLKKVINTKKKACVIGVLVSLLFVTAGTVFFVLQKDDQNHSKHSTENEQSAEKKKEDNYFSLSTSDRETADLYAELYEMSREDVAEQQRKTGDWEKTAEELEKLFFTIPENKKYQMEKEGYALEDLQEAERLSAKTGRKAVELAEAKGKVSDHRKWSDIVKDSEILSTEEQLGLTKEQVQKLEDMTLEKEDRVEVAVLLLNKMYTFDEVIEELVGGKTVEDLKKQKTSS